MDTSKRSAFVAASKRRKGGTAFLATVAVCSVGLLTALNGTAQAAIVSQWDFELNSAFDLDATVDDTGASPGGVNATAGTQNPFWESVLGAGNAPASIWWGGGGATPPNVSGITIGKTDVTGSFVDPGPHTEDGAAGPGSYVGQFGGGGDATGLTTNADFTQTVNFSHHNREIPTGPSLEETNVLSQLTLTPAGGGSSEGLSLLFNVLFLETQNTAEPLSNPENDDIFVIGVPGEDFAGDTVSQTFTFEGVPYRVDLRLDGLSTLTDAQCALVGAPAGCSGLVTTEEQINTFMAELRITAIPVPPAGVLLVSALAGLGAVARRKKKMQQLQAA